MARGKVQIELIQNPANRRVTFCKRKGGLLKKASQISTLCDVEVGLIIFSPSGKLYEFASSSMNEILENYLASCDFMEQQTESSLNIEMKNHPKVQKPEKQISKPSKEMKNHSKVQKPEKWISKPSKERKNHPKVQKPEKWISKPSKEMKNHPKVQKSEKRISKPSKEKICNEVENLQKGLNNLEKNCKNMVGEDLDSLSFKELQVLEKKINSSVTNIRSKMEKMSLEHIAFLKAKLQSLKAENANLCKKIAGSHKARDNFELETDYAAQQYLPQANLNLTLSQIGIQQVAHQIFFEHFI